MVPHTPRGRSILPPRTPPKNVLTGPREYRGSRSHSRPPMVNYPQHATKSKHGATHPLWRVPPLRDTLTDEVSPRCTKPHLTRTQDEKWTCVATRNPIQEPSARTPTSYTTTDEIRYHTPPAGVSSPTIETPPKASTDEAQGENRACAVTQRPAPRAPITSPLDA
ncbi:hypothetical protein BS47DRAFT_1369632 [Hydnum rufescens UP504]|uniref:Uncharacterized protein n=1 Tax=Hydnum rufescens UP504 TaxID=1448309 RepID=A0A9P6DLK2_9AGAM|nr:hypothetical protein BS47DRAFT_1369632 [Hydnum rufescens UP504]